MGTNDYIAFISNGKEMSAASVTEIVDLEPHDQVIQADECTCTHKEHISSCEIENIAVEVENSKKRISKYIVEMAFCKECGAYYMPQKSYEYLTNKGAISHHIKGGIRLFEYMKSGESFDEEKEQLEKIESALNKEYTNLPKPVSRYAIDDGCGGLNDIQGQKYSAKHIYEMQDALNNLMSEPYVGRIDVSSNGEGRKTYYIGRTEDKSIGGIFVHSRWSDEGRLFGRTAEATGSIGGSTKQVDLRRKIDIMSGSLRGVEDVFSSNSEFAEKGIYDKFLIQVLMSRKKSHQLTDIIATIQDKQNEIIEKAYVANLIVQGCAGSGKTMVMLHRLSFWLYNNKSLKPEKIKILTPNENFNVHIGGLHSQLNLGAIEIMSVDQYYAMLLKKYDKEISSFKKVDEEENIEERFLNYIYSKPFTKQFMTQYMEIIGDYATESEIEFVNMCAQKCDFNLVIKQESSDGDKIVELTRMIHQIASKISTALSNMDRFEEKISRYKDKVEKSIERKRKAEIFTSKFEMDFKLEIVPGIKKAIDEQKVILEDISIQIDEKEKTIEALSKSLLRILNGANIRKEETALEKIKKSQDDAQKKVKAFELLLSELEDIDNLEEAIEKINSRKATKEDSSILSSLAEYRKEKRVLFEQESNISKALEEQKNEEKNLREIDMLLTVEESAEVKKLCIKYTKDIVLTIFNRVFDLAIAEKLKELDMKRPEKTYRFELYSRVLFAEKLWNKVVGEDELICVDEGQDVSYCEYERIITQNQNNHTFYNVFGDLNQRIKQGRGLKTWEQLKRKLLAHEFLLNENYRNTNQITQYCNDVFNFDMTLTGVEGEAVRNITFDEMMSELVDIANTDDRTAIILPRTISKQRVTRAKKAEKIKNRFSTKFDVTKFSVMYVDEIKGIEFERVFVVDQDMERNERYIAFTRALDKLTIVH